MQSEKKSAALKKELCPDLTSCCILASEPFVLELTPAPLLHAKDS